MKTAENIDTTKSYSGIIEGCESTLSPYCGKLLLSYANLPDVNEIY